MRDSALQYFKYSHLVPGLQHTSRRCAELANEMEATLPVCSQKELGLQRLLEAKDCFVRARMLNADDDEAPMLGHFEIPVGCPEEFVPIADAIKWLASWVADDELPKPINLAEMKDIRRKLFALRRQIAMAMYGETGTTEISSPV